MPPVFCRYEGDFIMSNFLVLCTFFVGLLNIIILLTVINDLQELKADLYYYSEQKSDGDVDK